MQNFELINRVGP